MRYKDNQEKGEVRAVVNKEFIREEAPEKLKIPIETPALVWRIAMGNFI